MGLHLSKNKLSNALSLNTDILGYQMSLARNAAFVHNIGLRKCEHEERRRSLTSSTDRPRKKDFPAAVGTGTILGNNIGLLGTPVHQPVCQGAAVMGPHIVHTLNLKSSAFKLVTYPSKRTGGICSRKDVLSHKETPRKIFETPVTTKTCNLEVKDTIVLQQAFHNTKKLLVTANTNMLRHFQTGNSVEAFLGEVISFLDLHGVL
mmetsp:Transcript_6286/g.9256  ORF Transcript_6286/g.9256 Transcript_6286/m.9256 type:complete len:205 (+) Transcript_6286:93-707(+)